MIATRFARWLDGAPRLVAESLVEVGDLACEGLDPGERRDPEEVAAAIARALLPDEAPDEPPPWLRPDQATSFRRALAAARRFGGALLADAVGSGKTYVALAVAQRLAPEEAIDVVAPAVLLDTWRRAAARLGIGIRLTSHERVSRGDAPEGRGLVIIDESHRFRTPGTRRYQVLAPRLVGRPVLLVSATPVVNRLSDLAAQLKLAARDDALRFHGVASLERALSRGEAPPALAALVIAEPRPAGGVPQRRVYPIGDWLADDPAQGAALGLLDRLRFSRDPGVGALLRTGFLRAFGSSPAALRGMVRRYALLLEHARAARQAGRRVSRRDVERQVGALPDQLVMWELLDDPGAPVELALGDRELLRRLDRGLAPVEIAGDRKVALLHAVLADRRPTVVFTGWTDTVDHLRRRLGFSGIAWINGARAGIGPCRYPRRAVLAAFDPTLSSELPAHLLPWLLLSTDVAAEGLNLHRAGRVVHYDLPWTQVRIDQRDGRAVRWGSVHPDVLVVRFDPPPALEARLLVTARLERKASLPGAVGLGPLLGGAWAWRRMLASEWRDRPAARGWAAVRATRAGALLGYRLEAPGGIGVGVALARDPAGRWTDDPAVVASCLEAACGGEPLGTPAPGLPRRALDSAAPLLRRHLQAANGTRWLGAAPPGAAAAVREARRRLDHARRARRAREEFEADRVLALLARGHTAGEEALIAALGRGRGRGRGEADDDPAWSRLATLEPDRADGAGAVRVELVGLLILVQRENPGGAAG